MLSTSDGRKGVNLRQVYRIATVARGKLGAAADRPEHNLRLLVGHANFLDELTDTLINSPTEPDRPTSDKLTDLFNGLDQESEESDCDDSDSDASVEDEIVKNELAIEQAIEQTNTEMLAPDIVRPKPRKQAPYLTAMSDMPELKRMKPLSILESIDEEALDEEVTAAAKAIVVAPVALQVLQTLQTLQIAEVQAIVETTEATVCADAPRPIDAGSTPLTPSPIMAAAT